MATQDTVEKLLFWQHGKRARRDAQLLTSKLASLARGYTGSRVGSPGKRPEKRLVLYELENCPFSRKAREALSILDIDADIRPCPEGATKHRGELKSIGGKEQIPLLFDPNTMAIVYDSDAIVAYLFEQYGSGKPPLSLRARPLATLSSKVASYLRGGHDATRLELARRPELPLELWAYEASPESRLVRETLDRYAMPYVLHNAARGSANTRELERLDPGGNVPYLVDPNRKVSISGAGNINAYLRDTYAANGSKKPQKLERKPRRAPA
jgi:glutathione S-transferase